MKRIGTIAMDLIRFVAFALRPTTRSPEAFDWFDIIRLFFALGGLGGLGRAGRWLDDSVKAAEAGATTPDWFFTVVFPLAGFAILAVVAGTR